MSSRISFDADWHDYQDGLRLCTEGEVVFNGRAVCKVGVYRKLSNGLDYARRDTVLVPTGRAQSFTSDRLRRLVEDEQEAALND